MSDTSLGLSMVLFGQHPRLSAHAIRTHFAATWPGLPSVSDPREDENTISFRVGSADVVVGVMPVPVPWADLEGPCATSILWPDAATALQDHAAHAIVTVIGEPEPLGLSRLLTQATVSIMATSAEALGVYWTNAPLVAPKDVFSEMAMARLPAPALLPIWVEFRVGTGETQSSTGFTSGMAALGHMELEAQDAPESVPALRERFLAIAAYLVEYGPVIQDGDTVGESADERIRVVYADSAFGRKGKVIRLAYEPSRTGKPWWKPW